MRIAQSKQTLFTESIYYLRKDLYQKYIPFQASGECESLSCISTDFVTTQVWDFGYFKIQPTQKIYLNEEWVGFINFIENPYWITRRPPPHRFGILIASLLAFITMRPVKNSVKELYDLMNIDQNKLFKLAFTHPIEEKYCTPDYYFTPVIEDQYIQEIKIILDKILHMTEDEYKSILENFRVIQLSINIKSEDFGLAYSLLIQAIESIAQKKFPQRKKDAKTYHINKKFKDFINEYCPVSKWDNLLHTNKLMDEMVHEIPVTFRDSLPSELSLLEHELSLRLTYDLRSKFVHQGQQPPHSYPGLHTFPYFEHTKIPFTCEIEQDGKKEKITKETHLISYELMLAIAKHSIIQWIKSLK